MHLLLVGNFPQSEKFIVFSGEQANGGLCYVYFGWWSIGTGNV